MFLLLLNIFTQVSLRGHLLPSQRYALFLSCSIHVPNCFFKWLGTYMPGIDVPYSFFLVHNFSTNFCIFVYGLARCSTLPFNVFATSYTLFTISLKKPLWRNVGYGNKLSKNTCWCWIIYIYLFKSSTPVAFTSDPRIRMLEKLGEKQNEICEYMQNFWRTVDLTNLYRNGWSSNFKVSVGNDLEDLKLQASVDKLLE